MSAAPNREYSRLIVAPDVWPKTREEFQAKAEAWRAAANASSAAADTHRAAVNGLRADGVAQSTGFEAMHTTHWRNQVAADDLTDIRSAGADLMNNIVDIQQRAEQGIDAIDADAHTQLSSVPPRSPAAIGIIVDAAAMARRSAVGATAEITALSNCFASRFGQVPESPGSKSGDESGGGERPSPPKESQAESTSDDFGGSRRPDAPAGQGGRSEGIGDSRKLTTAAGFGEERPSVAVPSAPTSPPLRGGGSAGGVPSFGVGGSSPLSAGGGVGGFGGGMSPSSLLSGAGAGGGVPYGASQSPPAAALSRALPPPVVPPVSFGSAGSPSPTSSAVPTPLQAPAGGALSAGAVAHPPAAAAPGAVTPPAAGSPSSAASGVPVQPVAAAPLLPPGPMGPPAGLAPAAGSSVPGPAGAMGPASASVAAAAAVATPVATLPSRVAAAAARDFERQRNESSDVQLVKRVAWELLYATQSGFSFALWAVGVMYSATGERRVVALTQHGVGYVPAGVAVPNEVQMLWSDPVIDDNFRARWTGNLDPAATLVAYAELKAADSAAWRLAAAATTWSDVGALMTAAQRWGTEWAACSSMTMPTGIKKSVEASGPETAHRLVREFPELAARIAELRPRGLEHRVAKLITDTLVEQARLVVVDMTFMPGQSRFPANFDAVWPAAAHGRVPSAERAQFAEGVQEHWLSIAAVQPGWDVARSARSVSNDGRYQAQWLISRALEVVLGWVADISTDSKPAELPLADMVYAAVHAHLDGSGERWIDAVLAESEKKPR